MPISESNKKKPYCNLICVGSELLRGKINTHASTLARRLMAVGLELSQEHTVADDVKALTQTIRTAMRESDIVIVTGGLGPTFDDLSREAAAQAVGRRLIRSQALLGEIQRKFKKARYLRMPPANQRQADLIEGAEAIANKTGTAPGQWLELDGQVLILLPGPPSELHPMLDDIVLPKLRKRFPQRPSAEAHLHFVGVPESIVDDKLRPLIAKEKDARFTILAHLGLVDFDIFVSGSSHAQVQRRIARLSNHIRRTMGSAFYGMNDDYPLEKVVGAAFLKNKATLAVAESCTGGMLAKTLTDIPGSSDYFLGGIVSYSNAIKQSLLGVPAKMLSDYGAVSKEVAAAMAQGVRAKLNSTWGVGITGVAGPSGGSVAKPVGLVYISLSGPNQTRTMEYRFRGTRSSIRERALISALDLLRLVHH